MARSRLRPRIVLGALAFVAGLALAAPPPARPSVDLSSYGGLATWIDIYSPQAWSNPGGTISAIASRGARTVFLETGNYRQDVDLVRPAGLGRLIEAAHAAGLQVVAWYLPSFVKPARDLRRARAAIEFRTPAGERFDSFALDIESSAVKLPSRRTARLLALSHDLRAATGKDYPLGAIIPSPRGLELRPKYWPGFPFKRLAKLYDVFVPMAYYTYHVHGEQAVHDDVARSIALLREQTGRPDVPIHVIGGLADASGKADVRGFLRAVADCGPLGYSLYDYHATTPFAWKLLSAPSAGDPAGCELTAAR